MVQCYLSIKGSLKLRISLNFNERLQDAKPCSFMYTCGGATSGNLMAYEPDTSSGNQSHKYETPFACQIFVPVASGTQNRAPIYDVEINMAEMQAIGA